VFVLIVCLVIAVCAAASHLAIRWLNIKATGWGGHKLYGSETLKTLALLHSSSPGYDGIDWDRISEFVGQNIESWATPGSSPSEWEMMQSRSPDDARVFIAVSAYDLNENFLCDFRAEIVPLTETIRDLRLSGAEWPFSRRILDQYPVMFIRQLFPTVGRSDGVMVGLRSKIQRVFGRTVAAGDAPKFAATGKSEIAERLSDWDEARLERRLVLMQTAVEGKHPFNGPKKLALSRILQRAEKQGPVVFLVLPNSPAYRQALMTTAETQEFENELSDLQRLNPQTPMVRLDQFPDLDHNAYYYDLVHLNMYGQQIATDTFLTRLKELATY
jgi:hypothetical protein